MTASDNEKQALHDHPVCPLYSEADLKQSKLFWNNFVRFSKYCSIFVAILVVLVVLIIV